MADQVAVGYIASIGHNTAENIQHKPTDTNPTGTNGNTLFFKADAGTCVGGTTVTDPMTMNAIYKIFINKMSDCPSDKRRLTLEEATIIKDGLIPLMDQWDIIKLAGGKITGKGYGNDIIPGEFDDGFGWVFLVDAGFRFYNKLFLKSLGDIPKGWRRATVEECRSGPQADQIRLNLGEWDIVKVAGGKFTGSGYGSEVTQGYFDDGVGWVILVSH